MKKVFSHIIIVIGLVTLGSHVSFAQNNTDYLNETGEAAPSQASSTRTTAAPNTPVVNLDAEDGDYLNETGAQSPLPLKNETYTLLEPLPSIQGVPQDPKCVSGNTLTCMTLSSYIQYIFKFGIALAVFLATVMIIWGGFQYVISENPFKKTDGKETINNAIFGLIAALASYLILRTIDPRLVMVNTVIPPVCDVTNTQPGKFCDPDTVSKLTNAVEQKLNQLTKQERTEIYGMWEQVKALEQKKANLQNQCYNIDDPSDPDYISEAECDKQLAALDGQINKISAEASQRTTSRLVAIPYEKGIEMIAGGSATKEDIDAQKYGMEVAYLKDINDPVISGNPAEKQKLVDQYNYMYKDLDEEKSLQDLYKDYAKWVKVYNGVIGGSSQQANIIRTERTRLLQAQANTDAAIQFLSATGESPAHVENVLKSSGQLEMMKKIKADPKFKDEQLPILNGRLARIRNTLAQNPTGNIK